GIEHRLEQDFLRCEVEVERARFHSCPARDLANGRARLALVAKQPGGHDQQTDAGIPGVARRGHQKESRVPRMAVTWLDSTPPLPWASASRAPGTCRSPAPPRSCSTASTSVKSPYMRGCTHDSPPPFVF